MVIKFTQVTVTTGNSNEEMEIAIENIII